MKTFLKSLLAAGTGVSSKRASALFVLINLIGISWYGVFKADNGLLPEYMFNALSFLVGAGLGLTSIEKFIPKKLDESNENKDI